MKLLIFFVIKKEMSVEVSEDATAEEINEAIDRVAEELSQTYEYSIEDWEFEGAVEIYDNFELTEVKPEENDATDK